MAGTSCSEDSDCEYFNCMEYVYEGYFGNDDDNYANLYCSDGICYNEYGVCSSPGVPLCSVVNDFHLTQTSKSNYAG